MMLSFSTRKSRYFTIGNYRVLWTCFCQWRTLWKSPWLSFALKESLSSSRRTRSPTYKRARFASFCKSVSKQINLKYQTLEVSKVGNFENCYVNNKIDDIINHFSDWTTLFEKVVWLDFFKLLRNFSDIDIWSWYLHNRNRHKTNFSFVNHNAH